jgi:hypothetical protein
MLFEGEFGMDQRDCLCCYLFRKADSFSVIYEGTLGRYVTSVSCRAFLLFKFFFLVTLSRKRS